MSEELKIMLQALGPGAIGLIALWLYHKAVMGLVELLVKEQHYKEKIFEIAEDKQLVMRLLLKALEVVSKHGRESAETWEDLRAEARTALDQTAHPQSPK